MALIERLMARGVRIPHPQSVWIAEEVDEERIFPGAVIYPGCRIQGKKTLILPAARIGAEAPATVDNCYVGPDVALKGGYFKGAVFLEGAQMGSGAHVREGTILEEGASGAHTVGLKQTLLFPFVTLGSLINFCDCLMSGGTSPKDHGEVGSSYIHFNYTPNQDKATASLLGDVPRGVMLDQPPIFLGGQGGLVGPCRIGFGNVIAAGYVYRKDEPGSGHLLIGAVGRGGRVPYKRGNLQNISRIVENNVHYIANLLALMEWYRKVRSMFVSDRFPQALLEGLIDTLGVAIKERIHRLDGFLESAAGSQSDVNLEENTTRSQRLVQDRRGIIDRLGTVEGSLPTPDAAMRQNFLDGLHGFLKNHEKAYITAIQCLGPEVRSAGTRWLQSVVDGVIRQTLGPISPQSPGLDTRGEGRG